MLEQMLFVIINSLILLFTVLTVKDYRELSRQLGDVRDKNDPMSIGFLEKIFHARSDEPTIRNKQKKVLRNGGYVALLVVLSRYLYLAIS